MVRGSGIMIRYGYQTASECSFLLLQIHSPQSSGPSRIGDPDGYFYCQGSPVFELADSTREDGDGHLTTIFSCPDSDSCHHQYFTT